MSMQNCTAMRQIIEEGFNKGNYAALPQVVHPDFIEHQFGLHATLPGLQRTMEYCRGAFPDFHLTIEEMVADGDKVWVRMTARGTNLGGVMGPPNGKSFEVCVFDECRFENGLMVEHWGSPDRFAQLVQLGLLPLPQAAEASRPPA